MTRRDDTPEPTTRLGTLRHLLRPSTPTDVRRRSRLRAAFARALWERLQIPRAVFDFVVGPPARLAVAAPARKRRPRGA